MTCLTYLLMEDFQKSEPNNVDLDSVLQKYPFLRYAARFWPIHVAQSGAEKEMQPLIQRLMTPKPNRSFLFWIRIIVTVSRTGPYRNFRPHPLYYAASWGLRETVSSLLAQGASIDDRAGGYQGTALHAACFRGHPKVLKLLLEHGADVFIQDSQKINVFHLADWCGVPEVIELLIDHVKKSGLSMPRDVDLAATLARLRAADRAGAATLSDRVYADTGVKKTHLDYVELHGHGLFRKPAEPSMASNPAVRKSADDGTSQRHLARPSPQGWWSCCKCRTPNNPSRSFDICPICHHQSCRFCEGHGSSMARRHRGMLPDVAQIR